MNTNQQNTSNNDLLIMLGMGGIIYTVTHGLLPLSLQHQFLVSLIFSLVAGLFMTSFLQSLEWSFFFALGMQVVTLAPLAINALLTDQFSAITLIQQALSTGYSSLFLLSPWLIGIPAGFMLQKLIMTNYYRVRGLW